MAKLGIPSLDKILNKGITEIIREKKRPNLGELVKNSNFSEIIVEIENRAHKIYLKEEQKAVTNKLIGKGLSYKSAEIVSKVFIDEDLVTSIANTRRARGGLSSEAILREVLRSIGIPCEKGRIRVGGYRPDLAVPSNAVLEKNPDKAVAIAVKRTLRERWAEDIDVFKFPRGMFVLFLPDPDFNKSKAQDMVSRNMKEIYINDKLFDASKDFLTDQFKRLSDLPLNLMKFANTPQKTLNM